MQYLVQLRHGFLAHSKVSPTHQSHLLDTTLTPKQACDKIGLCLSVFDHKSCMLKTIADDFWLYYVPGLFQLSPDSCFSLEKYPGIFEAPKIDFSCQKF
jgi:hypothetical protein